MSQQTSTHTLAQLHEILQVLWGDPSLPAAVLIGPPGSGKSSLVEDVARSMDMPCEIMMANICEPSDFSGLPCIEGKSVHMYPLEWARRIAGTRCVLFLDEINTARPATIAALLRVILNHKVGEVDLGPEVRIVAAMNIAEESAHGWELPPALANRFFHLAVAPTPLHQWKTWAHSRNPSSELADLITNLETETLHDEAVSGPFGSPRSWHAGLRAVAACRTAGRADLGVSLMAASVGLGNALAWSAAFNATNIDWAKPQPSAIVRRAITQLADKVKSGAEPTTKLWSLLNTTRQNNLAATYSTVGHMREYLQTIADSAEAIAVFSAIEAAMMEDGGQA